MAKGKKLTPLQQEYNKELAKLKRRIKTQEKKGYKVSKDVIPERPKRITKKSINKLKSIKAKVILSYATKEEHIPTFSAIARFEAELALVPDAVNIRGMRMSVENERNILVSKFMEALNNDAKALEKKLAETQETWLYNFDIIRYNESNYDAIIASFVAIANILSSALNSNLTLSELSALNDLEELYYVE